MEKKQYKFSDQVIGQIRELLQLSLLSQTNFVDHMRAVRVEISEETGNLILAKDYVEGWNQMAEEMFQKAYEKVEQMASTIATDTPTDDSAEEIDSEEVVISRDPETGKLTVSRQGVPVGSQG